MLGFWEKLKKPIIVLAPMADVTDAAFRIVINKYGKPHVTWTEFVSADGLCHPKGREKLIKDLSFTEAERPIVAQLFTAHPDKMREAAALVQKLGFDGLDINMGCPDRAVEKQGAGAALIKNPKVAREVIRAAREGAPHLPISVKTRIGYNKNELETWLPELLAENPAVITIHARTRKEMSKVPARWEYVREAVEIRNKLRSKTLIFGNGDILSVSDAKAKATEFGADGVMLGRAIFGNPWLFSENGKALSTKEKLLGLIEHTNLFAEHLTGYKSFAVMKKHFKSYVDGFEGAKELRIQLMETENATQVKEMLEHFIKNIH